MMLACTVAVAESHQHLFMIDRLLSSAGSTYNNTTTTYSEQSHICRLPS